MEITTHNCIELKLKIKDSNYSLTIPYGAQLDDAVEACNFFVSGLLKLKKESEEKDKTDDDGNKEQS